MSEAVELAVAALVLVVAVGQRVLAGYSQRVILGEGAALVVGLAPRAIRVDVALDVRAREVRAEILERIEAPARGNNERNAQIHSGADWI